YPRRRLSLEWQEDGLLNLKMSRRGQAPIRHMFDATWGDEIGEVINFAQTPTSRASRVRWRSYRSNFMASSRWSLDLQQHSPTRQKSGYFGVIAIILIVA